MCATATTSRSSASGVGAAGWTTSTPKSPLAHLLVGDLVGVVPVAPRLPGHEPVGVLLARPHGVLGDAGDTVLGVRHVDAVPVQRDPVGDVVVGQPHLEELALGDVDLGAGRGAVEGVPVLDLAPRCQLQRLPTGDEVDDVVGGPVGAGGQVGDAARTRHVVVSVRHRPRAAAVVVVPHLHDGVRRRHPALLPEVAERQHDDEGSGTGEQQPQPVAAHRAATLARLSLPPLAANRRVPVRPSPRQSEPRPPTAWRSASRSSRRRRSRRR